MISVEDAQIKIIINHAADELQKLEISKKSIILTAAQALAEIIPKTQVCAELVNGFKSKRIKMSESWIQIILPDEFKRGYESKQQKCTSADVDNKRTKEETSTLEITASPLSNNYYQASNMLEDKDNTIARLKERITELEHSQSKESYKVYEVSTALLNSCLAQLIKKNAEYVYVVTKEDRIITVIAHKPQNDEEIWELMS
jgi:hypothetical protein